MLSTAFKAVFTMVYIEKQPREIEQNPKESFLSPREMEVLLLVSQGSANKQIARELGISKQTVKNHISYCLRKLGAPDRTEAAVIFTQTLAFLAEQCPDFTFKEFQKAIFVFSRSKNEMPFASALPRLNKFLEDAKDTEEKQKEREEKQKEREEKQKERKRAVISALLYNPEARAEEIVTAHRWHPDTIRVDISRLYKKYGIKRGNWKEMRRQLVEKAREAGEI